MAPLKIRQNHSFTPSPPRPPKGPYTQPVSVNAQINPAVLGELFAGTVGIFIFAVLFWKIGKYVRSLNRHRVLREGKLTTTRYARTWYGWVPLDVHERNKRIIVNIFSWIFDWLSWESSRMDYSWVWWDPGQKMTQKRRRRSKTPSWMPRFLQRYEPRPADQIWNPGSPTECHGALIDIIETQTDQMTEPSIANSTISLSRLSQELSRTHISEVSESSIYQECFTQFEHMHGSYEDNNSQQSEVFAATIRTISPTPFNKTCPPKLQSQNMIPPLGIKSWSVPDFNKVTVHSNDRLENQGNPQLKNCRLYVDSQRMRGQPIAEPIPKAHRRHAQLRKCRAWSAKMQVKANRLVPCKLRDSSGPPGTPFTDILSTFRSEQTALESIPTNRESGDNRALGHLAGQVVLNQCYKPIPSAPFDAITKFHTLPARFRPQSGHMSAEEVVSSPIFETIGHARGLQVRQMLTFRGKSSSQNDKVFLDRLDRRADDELCDWEIRLIDGLNRKLVWIFNETTPGQKPYHFAQLANHWLNRETWLVIDPVSRVPLDSRRERGDPRFNVPYPEPTYDSKPKYPVPIQKRAYTPRIDSWRATVNRRRRISGLRDAVRTVELYENSIEEPPDGHIDPGCWMFPRPPQGFEVSTKQKDGWYEGGTGWQETFEDWQHIGWGYRLRKTIQEGRVNRHWAKGIASRVHRGCRSTSLNIISKDAQRVPASRVAVV
ncbi:hypothetical protein N7481_005834 [Penicillium waksmanii]|uniref:uncharacterized protein n=1 Tax=Penicillium waksmanii TaxID=69791 RepID=UPI002546BD0A|nr:uncharacterized protein N7481_005834 [Penicillium waksmanii]KAJ5983735.1 hypothetical protein N7481_005834 [Penicillium waksmanii]